MLPPNIDLRAIVIAARRELFSRSFAAFVAYFWPVVEPTRALLPSVAMDGMIAAAQAWADGRITRLAVSTCPGTAKSVVWAVMLPAWLELRTQGKARIMVGSYSWAFATRDSQRCRDLVQSPQFQEIVGGEWSIRDDANHKDDWWTSATGRRLITSVEGKSTGERCTWQIIDDALSAADVFSNPAKLEAIRWINQVLTSRLEDQRTDPRVIVGQRLSDDDPIADALQRSWTYMYLPATLAEGEAPCILLDDNGVEVWRDPRQPGEPITELLDRTALERLQRDLGTLAYSAQYLQKPLPMGGAMFKRAWFPIVDVAPSGGRAVRGWDLAATANEAAAATAGVKLRLVDGRIYVENCRWLQGSPHQVEELLTGTAAEDGYQVEIDIPQDPGQAGKSQVAYLARKLQGYVARFSPETGSKELRAQAFAAQAEAGNVSLVRGPWNEAYLDELEAFPAAKLKDRVDATSRAYAALISGDDDSPIAAPILTIRG